MIILILNFILAYVFDTLLVGVAFVSLRERFKWDLSPKKCFFILLIIFALYDNYLTPMFLVLDATITIRNEAIAQALGITPNLPLVELLDLDMFAFITWCIQAFLAGLFGDKLISKKTKKHI